MAVAPSRTLTEPRLLPAAPPRRRVGCARLSVVVVNFCQWQNTARLVRQLRRCRRLDSAELVVVDNASPPHDLADEVAGTPGVRVLSNRDNVGFARAVNQGVAASSGEWVLLLNPDVTVEPGLIDRLLRALKRWSAKRPRAGVVGWRLADPDGAAQGSAGFDPTWWGTLAGLVKPRSRRKCEALPGDTPRAVEWVTGGCLAVRRSCFDALGGLDERYFLYYEDADLCRRARAAGWSVWFDPAVAVTHHSPLHGRKVPPPLRLITRHALLHYARTHWAPWQSAMLGRVVRLEALARGGDHRALGELAGAWGKGDGAAVDRLVRLAAGQLAPVAAAQDGA